MDIRIEKTEKAIKNAFLELRSKKALEKITVRELCSLANINKSTFYSNYTDIYALSEAMESETIGSVLKNISSMQKNPFQEPAVFTRNLYMALLANNSLIRLLFDGKSTTSLGERLETELKNLIWQAHPEYREDTRKNILISYAVQGSYYAWLNHPEADPGLMIDLLEEIVRRLAPMYLEE